MTQNRKLPVPHRLGTLNKSVLLLAMEPRSMALTPTSRKIYSVLIKIAQLQRQGADGSFRARLADVIHDAVSSTKVAERIQGYIDQMTQTTFLMHLVTNADAGTLSLEGFEMPEGPPSDLQEGEERRTFALLAEVRWSFERGQHWLQWWFPPSILEQLLSPERWAQIDFSNYMRLSSYAALSLYEILARFKDSPGGLTARRPPQWWQAVLREGGPSSKPREWRKFKNETLKPALEEIVSKTEIHAELVEIRQRGIVVEVQFRVARQQVPIAPARPGETVDVSMPLYAAKLGVSEEDLQALVDQFGAMQTAEGLKALEAALAKPGKTVTKPAAYLRRILENRSAQAPEPGEVEVLSPTEKAVPQSLHEREERLRKAYRTARLSELEGEFDRLSVEEQTSFLEKAREKVPNTPGTLKRLALREWRSPLIREVVLGEYAAVYHGPGWNSPTAAQLEEIAHMQEAPRLSIYDSSR